MLIFPGIDDPYREILCESFMNPQHALKRAQEIRPVQDSPMERGLAAYTYGCCLIACERFDQAQRLIEAAICHFGALPSHVMSLYCEHARQFGALFTDAPTEIEPWERLIAEYQRRALPEATAMAAMAMARACYLQRNIARVDTLINAWLPLVSPSDHPFVAGSLVRLQALVILNKSDFTQADALFRKAITIFESGYCAIEATHCLIDLAWSRLLQGDPIQAISWLEEVDGVFGYHDLPLRRALCAHNLSIAYLQLGEFAQAIYTSYKARKLFKEVGRTLLIGSCDMQLGRIYSYIGHWTAAIAQLLSAIRLYETFGAAGRLSSCYYNLAVAWAGKGDFKEAIAIIEQAKILANDESNHEILRELDLLRARILGQLEQFDVSYDLIEQTAAKFATINHQLGQARCLIEQGWLEIGRDAFDRARERFDFANTTLHDQLVYQWRALHGLARCLQHERAYAPALDHYERAMHMVSRFRLRLANEHLSSLLFMQAETLFDDALICAIDHGSAELVLRLTENHRTLTLQRLLDVPLDGLPAPGLDAIETDVLVLIKQWYASAGADAVAHRLDEQLKHYAEQIWLNRHTISLADNSEIALDSGQVAQRLNELHGHDWTLVSFLIHGARLVINIQTPERIILHQTRWDSTIETLIQQLGNRHSQRRIYNDVPFHQKVTTRRWEQLEGLADRLLPPEVQERLHGDHRLYIVPSGMLHMIAWATLRVHGMWLCECAVVQVLPYAMFALRQMGVPSAAMLQLACSDFAGRAATLPETGRELSEIAAIWPVRPEALIDDQCIVSAICDPEVIRLDGYGVIHIASHAYMTTRHGIAGHIMVHDGDLWLDKITRLQLRDALVFLSVCNGAVTDNLPGEESVSLPWSWLIAGARAVVASLWPAVDGVTIPLIKSFYGHVARGVDVALALTLAQREEALHTKQSPLIWGNAVSIGSPMTVVGRGAGGTTPA